MHSIAQDSASSSECRGDILLLWFPAPKSCTSLLGSFHVHPQPLKRHIANNGSLIVNGCQVQKKLPIIQRRRPRKMWTYR
ncbi:unnamed protein product, partial [Brassica rapa subsp. narinosa]